MTGRHGAATKLLYELYIALGKKQKAKLTGVAIEAMRPAATTKLKSIESVLYREVNNYTCFVKVYRKKGILLTCASQACCMLPVPTF